MRFSGNLSRLCAAAPICAAALLLSGPAANAATTFTYTATMADSTNGLSAVAILTGSDVDGNGTIDFDNTLFMNEWQSASFTLYDTGTPFYSFTDVANGVIVNPFFQAAALPGIPYIIAFPQGDANGAIGYYYIGAPLFAAYDSVGNGFGSGYFDSLDVTVSEVPEPGAIAFGAVSLLSVTGLIIRRRKG